MPRTAATCHRPARAARADHDRAQTDDDARGGVTGNKREVNDRDDGGKGAAPHINLGLFPPTMNPAQLQRVTNLMLADGLLKSRLEVQPLLFH